MCIATYLYLFDADKADLYLEAITFASLTNASQQPSSKITALLPFSARFESVYFTFHYKQWNVQI